MPRVSTQHPPKYRKHRPTGRAVVTLNGRHYYLGKFNSSASRKEYDRLITLWTQGGGRLPEDSQQEITVGEVMLAYIAHAKVYYRKNGKVTREYGLVLDACRAIRPLYGETLAVKFGPLALKMVRQSLIDSGISRDHINRQVGRIKRMFRWSAAEEMIPASIPQALNMVTGLRKGRTEARETAPVRPVDDAIVDATLEYLPAIPADMVRFQRLTGCRPIEVRTVRPCDIDRSSDVWLYRPDSHKTEHHGRDRVIFVGPHAQEILLRYLARDSQMYCFRPCDSEEKRLSARNAARKTPKNCGNTRGSNRKRRPKRKPREIYDRITYARVVSRACEKSKVEKWSPGQLRHSTATEVRSKYGLEGSQIILGHASADVTQVYAERDATLGIRIAREIG